MLLCKWDSLLLRNCIQNSFVWALSYKRNYFYQTVVHKVTSLMRKSCLLAVSHFLKSTSAQPRVSFNFNRFRCLVFKAHIDQIQSHNAKLSQVKLVFGSRILSLSDTGCMQKPKSGYLQNRLDIIL